MKIFIKKLDGIIIEIDGIESNNSIKSLKYLIYERENILPKQQRLIFRGSPLLDDKLLSESNISENSTIHLLYQLYSRIK
jgi:hypothetical protein